MAKRFHSGFFSDNGTEYDVEIWDSAFAGASTSFVVDGRGFEIEWDGESTKTYSAVIGSRAAFGIQVQAANASAIATFITDLLTADEKKFQILIKKGGTAYWWGNVLNDLSRYADHEPQLFEVAATCGLGMLKDVDYKNGNLPYSGWQTILEHVVNCLDKIGTNATFFTSENIIATVANWYEDSHTTGNAEDPLTKTRCLHDALFEIDDAGFYKWKSAFEVLEQLAQRFLLRIFLANGAWRIEQFSERDNATVRVRSYTKAGVYVTNSSANYNITLNQAAEARLGGGQFDWFPALREVKERYKHRNRNNYLAGASWTSTTSNTFTASPDISSSGAAILQVAGIQSRTFTRLSGFVDNHEILAVFTLELKVGSYYLKRNILQIQNGNVSFEGAQWTTTPSKFSFVYDYAFFNFPTSAGASVTMPGNIGLSTPALPSGGTLTAKIEYVSHRKKSNGAIIDPLSFTITWSFSSMSCQVYTGGNPADISNVIEYRVPGTATGNSAKIEFDSIIGDGEGANSVGRLQVYNGSAWSDSTAWRVGTTGTFDSIQNLFLTQYLSFQKTNARRWTGAMRGTMQFHSRISFDGNAWLAVRTKLTANVDEWEGVWLAVAVSTSGLTPSTPIPQLPPHVPTVPANLPPDGLGIPPPNTGASVAAALSSAQLQSDISTGIITSISTQALTAGAFSAGDLLAVVDTSTGAVLSLTVTADVEDGDTSVAVAGYAVQSFVSGSPVVWLPQNQTVQANQPGGGGGGGTMVLTLADIQAFFSQFVFSDSTNDASWRIEIPNIVAETDENAGNGSTAGIRFDGAGLNAYKSTSATGTVQVLPTGIWEVRTAGGTGTSASGIVIGSDSGVRAWRSSPGVASTFYLKNTGQLVFNHAAHPTVEAGIFYVNNGIIYLDFDGAGTKVHPQLGHLVRVSAIDFETSWVGSTNGTGFWRIPAEYNGLEIYKWSVSVGSTAGSGSGTNSISLWFEEADGSPSGALSTITTLTGSTKTATATFTAQAIATGDILYFQIASAQSTPAKGAFAEIYLRKP